MIQIPRWALGSAAAAPVFIIGGWTLAAELQPDSYDPIRDTISALAARGSTDRWVMTAGLLGAGSCYIVTAVGLSSPRRAGRLVLLIGGAATIAVGLFPQPVRGNSVAHTIAAATALISLAVWPVVSARRDALVPLLRRSVSTAATIAMLGLVVWFALELHGGHRGLAERAAAGAQSLWPLAVAVATAFPRLATNRNIGVRPGTG